MQTNENETNKKIKRLLLTTCQLLTITCLCGATPSVTFKTFSLTQFDAKAIADKIKPRESNWIQLPELHWDDDYFYCYGCFNISGEVVFSDFIRKVSQKYLARIVSYAHISVCAFNVSLKQSKNYTLNATIRAYRRNIGNYPCQNSTSASNYYPAFLNGFTGKNKLPTIFIKFNSTDVPKISQFLFFNQVVNTSNIMMPFLHQGQPYPIKISDDLFYYEPTPEITTTSASMTSTAVTSTSYQTSSHQTSNYTTKQQSTQVTKVKQYTTVQNATTTSQSPITKSTTKITCPTNPIPTTVQTKQLKAYICNCTGTDICLSQGIYSFDYFFGYDEFDFTCINTTGQHVKTGYLHDRKTHGSCYLNNLGLFMGGTTALTRDHVPICDPTLILALDLTTFIYVLLSLILSICLISAYLVHSINRTQIIFSSNIPKTDIY